MEGSINNLILVGVFSHSKKKSIHFRFLSLFLSLYLLDYISSFSFFLSLPPIVDIIYICIYVYISDNCYYFLFLFSSIFLANLFRG